TEFHEGIDNLDVALLTCPGERGIPHSGIGHVHIGPLPGQQTNDGGMASQCRLRDRRATSAAMLPVNLGTAAKQGFDLWYIASGCGFKKDFRHQWWQPSRR